MHWVGKILSHKANMFLERIVRLKTNFLLTYIVRYSWLHL